MSADLIRYSRQTVLPQVGLLGQEALRNAKVLIVGAGGLGQPCAQSLVAAGVGHISIVDDDQISLSNLPRQFLFDENDVGKNKVEVLQKKLSALNSNVNIEIFNERFTLQNAEKLISKNDLVIDGSDNFSTKFLINDACLIKKTPWIYASVSRFEGHLAVFTSGALQEEYSCYRCLYPKKPKAKIENCAEQGVFGAVAAIIGNYQALEALKILLKLKKNINNKDIEFNLKSNTLQVFDFETMNQKSFYISKQQNCFCENPIMSVFNQNNADLNQDVCVFSLEKKWSDFNLDQNKKILIDVRTADEFKESHHPQAEFLVQNELQELLPKISEHNIYLYCTTGQRAKTKCSELRKNGLSVFYINE